MNFQVRPVEGGSKVPHLLQPPPPDTVALFSVVAERSCRAATCCYPSTRHSQPFFPFRLLLCPLTLLPSRSPTSFIFFFSFHSSLPPPPHGSFTMRLSFSLSQKDGILCSMLPTRCFSLHRLRELSFSPLFAVSGKTLGGFSPFRESYSTLASFEIRCLFVVEYLLRLPAWFWSCVLFLELRV